MAARAGAKAPASDRDVDTNDNAVPLTDDQKADLLLVNLRRHREIDAELDKAMEVVRGINKRRKRLRNDIRTDGFVLRFIDELIHDEKKARHETEADARNRTFIRTVGRQPITGDDQEQMDLFVQPDTANGSPSLDGDDAAWAARAFAVALRGGDPSPVENEVPPERIQAWEQGLTKGMETFDIAKKNVAEIEARRAPA